MEFWRWRFLFIIGPTGGMLVDCEYALRSRYPIVSTYFPFIVGHEEKKKKKKLTVDSEDRIWGKPIQGFEDLGVCTTSRVV